MLRLAAGSCKSFEVDDREIRREGFSYMVDTLEEIRAESPGRPLFLLIGQDAANALDSWHRWRRLFELSHLVVLRRPGAEAGGSLSLLREVNDRSVSELKMLWKNQAGCVYPLDVTQLEISSTDIRAQCARGVSPRYLLPDPVLDYIREHELYSPIEA
jgi:nicotinate-nucleotide adenylyltransferase